MGINFGEVEKAAETWGMIRRIPDYEMVVGTALFKNLFKLAPQALEMFSFAKDWDDSSKSSTTKNSNSSNSATKLDHGIPQFIFESAAFRTHATGVVTTLGPVIQMMIGEDMANLTAMLHKLGARHVSYGVHAAHYKILETALLRTLQGALRQQEWTDQVRQGWVVVLNFIAQGMKAGAGAELEKLKHHRRNKEHDRLSAEATMRLQGIRQSPGTSRLRRSRSAMSANMPLPGRTLFPPRRESENLTPLLLPAWPQDEENIHFDDEPVFSRRNSGILPRRQRIDGPPSMPRRNMDGKGEADVERSSPPPKQRLQKKKTIVLPCSKPPSLPQRLRDKEGERDNSWSTDVTVESTVLDENDGDAATFFCRDETIRAVI